MRSGTRKQTQSVNKVQQILDKIKSKGDPKAIEGMSRFGIRADRAFGVSVPELRCIARRVGRSHDLAVAPWKTKVHEARLIVGMIDEPEMVTNEQMDEWASEFDSWDIVDGTCRNLFDKTPFAIDKAHQWSARREEYVKRAGFVLMAELAVHDKTMADGTFREFLPLIIKGSLDDRNFVKKAVNWALRQIGKRNVALHTAALSTCKTIQEVDSRSAKWIAADAMRELKSEAVRTRLRVS